MNAQQILRSKWDLEIFIKNAIEHAVEIFTTQTKYQVAGINVRIFSNNHICLIDNVEVHVSAPPISGIEQPLNP